MRTNPHPSVEEWLAVTPKPTLDLLASFQRTVIEELLRRAVASAEEIQARSLIVSGGVACNSGLRTAAQALQSALPGALPLAGSLHRQRRHDRGGRFPEIRARRVQRLHARGARQPHPGVGWK